MTAKNWAASEIKQRSRLLIDNDLAGDPDGLVQLAHHVLSPSVEVTAIIASAHNTLGVDQLAVDMIPKAVLAADKVLSLCKRSEIPVLPGSEGGLKNHQTPIDNEAARAIIAEAMRTDTDLPLFIACGAGLTALASAWLIEPKIAEKITLVWIGGHEYPGMMPPPPGATDMEYNLGIDIIAGQVIFNQSDIPIWQIPRGTYRSAIASRAELVTRLKPQGALGAFLFESLAEMISLANNFGLDQLGETYVLGDSPLVLLTVLQTAFEPDTASSYWEDVQCPQILDNGLYEPNSSGRTIRVFKQLDVRTMFEDMYAKFALHAMGEK